MASHRFRPALLGLIPFVLTACTGSDPAQAYPAASTAPTGVDLGSSASHMADRPASEIRPRLVGEGHEMRRPTGGEMQMAHEGHGGAHASGTVNSVDAAAHKLNVSHGPITELGWPPMTMDFPVAPSVDLKATKAGSHIDFLLGKSQDGMPITQSVEPSKQGG
jgi:Cu/Ag efflux protein CusF